MYSRGTNNNNNNKKWGSNAPSRNNHNSSPTPLNNNDTIVQDPAVVNQMHDRMLFLLGNLTVSQSRGNEQLKMQHGLTKLN